MDGDGEIFVDDQGRLMKRVRRVKQPVVEENNEKSHAAPSVELEDIQHMQRLLERRDVGDDVRNVGGKRKTLQEEAEIMRALRAETETLEMERARRECPVPKPKGVIGRFLGFDGEGGQKDVEER